MNAVIRVKRPIARSMPPTNSSTPENPAMEKRLIVPGIGEGGKPNNFEVPCSRNRSALMLRRTLNNWGDQVDIIRDLSQKKPEAATTTVKLPLLPFGSGGVGLLALCHSWPAEHNVRSGTLPLQIRKS